MAVTRHPQASSERRAAAALMADARAEDGVCVRVRAARNTRNLPSEYDDRCQVLDRTWKRHRDTQWSAR